MMRNAFDLNLEARVAEIFIASLDLPPDSRRQFLEQKCTGDENLHKRLDALLAADEAGDGFLNVTSRGDGSNVSAILLAVGSRIGRYEIVRIIGSGGMGVVYEAQQTHPQRRVALKVMSLTLLDAAARRRFEYESEIMAQLHHWGIAQVYESGVFNDVLPYFAMELVVDGQSLLEYANARGLNRADRLDLFGQVCEAVHHGHQNGVIHRDLKPANLLVDNQGQVKVIDFGVARVVSPHSANAYTTVGHIAGTPKYMSPEQCSDPQNRVPIDVRSDVYSLGVVLYELLTGRSPYATEGDSFAAMSKSVCELPPIPPAALDRTLRGDFQTILLKALEKDRVRRYQSALDLSQDVHRALDHLPISARRPTVAYQLRMFARRHRALVGGTLASLAILIGAMIVVLLMAIRVQRESSQRAEINQFLESLMVAGDAYPFVTTASSVPQFGANARWVDVIDAAVSKLDANEISDPLSEASIRHRVGMIYFWMCRFDEAMNQLQRAHVVRNELLGEDDPTTIDTRIGLSLCMVFLGDHYAAEESARKIVLDCKQSLGVANVRTLNALHAHFITLLYLEFGGELAVVANEMQSILDSHPDIGFPSSVPLTFRGYCELLAGNDNTAELLLMQSIKAAEIDSPNSLTHAWATMILGSLYGARDDYDRGIELMRSGCDMWHARSGPNMAEFEVFVDVMMCSHPLRQEEGLALLRNTIQAARSQFGEDHPFYSSVAHRASKGFMAAGHWEEAESALRSAMKCWERPRHVWLQRDAVTLWRLAECFREQGRLLEAQTECSRAVDLANRFDETLWAKHPLKSRAWFIREFERFQRANGDGST